MQPFPVLSAWTRSLALAICPLFFGELAAQPPPNDNCAGALIIPSNGPFPFEAQLVDVTDAMPDIVPFPPPQTNFDTNITRSVWYRFNPAASGLYTFSTGFDTDTTIRDTTMILYTGGANCGPFTIYSFNEDSGSLRAALSTNLTAGTDYYLVVWVGRTEVVPDGQRIDLVLRVTKPVAPPNDTCADAIVLPSSITAPYVTAVFDTTLAMTTETNVVRPPCVTNAGVIPSRDLWFQFTPATSGSYIFSTGSDTRTVIDDTAIGLYTLSGGCQSANQIACNDNSFGRAVLSQALTAGTTYYLVVWDNSPSYIPGETDLQLRVSPATAPTTTTLPPTVISGAGVTLNGTLNGNGLLSRFWFEWGPTPSLGSTSSPVRFIFASATTFTTNAVVTGFAPNTLYYYRLVATNNLGRSAAGPLQTFFWNDTPPQISREVFDAVPVPPNFNRASGPWRLEFGGFTNHLYTIQGSTNLIDWFDLGPAREASPAAFEFEHVPAPAPPRFYYRVKHP